MIKNIIFDFGGVIYDIDHQLSKKAFESLGLKNFEELYGHQVQSGLFEKMEKGEISEQDFRDSLALYLPKSTSNSQIDKAWNALLIGFDRAKIELLKSLSDHYRLFLLSNTNSIHCKQFMMELNLNMDFRSLFDDVWFSHEKQMRKPEKEFYLGLMNKHKLNPNETLFIDDLDTNIEAAKNLGIQTYYLKKEESILGLFNENKWNI